MISIFTPTYNRGYRLKDLYLSLVRQTCKEFEWIIVNDGSTDNTDELVANWMVADNGFTIIYEKQANGGKHSAINRGVVLANSDWFFIVDSDDYLVDDAVEYINEKIGELLLDPLCAGLSGTRMYKDGTIIGGRPKFTGEYIDCRNNERDIYGLGGDKSEIYKTEVLKQFRFPIFESERFVSECAVWDDIAIHNYYLRWFIKPLEVCEYLEDGLSAKIGLLELNNFQGYTYTMNVRLKAYCGVERIRLICQYINKAKKKKMNIGQIAKSINVNIIVITLLSVLVDIKNIVKKR